MDPLLFFDTRTSMLCYAEQCRWQWQGHACRASGAQRSLTACRHQQGHVGCRCRPIRSCQASQNERPLSVGHPFRKGQVAAVCPDAAREQPQPSRRDFGTRGWWRFELRQLDLLCRKLCQRRIALPALYLQTNKSSVPSQGLSGDGRSALTLLYNTSSHAPCLCMNEFLFNIPHCSYC